MGRFISIPLLALAAALQSSILPQVRIDGGQPDFVVLMVLAWAFRAELDEALIWAFVGGIMQDLLSIAPLGASTIGLLPTIFIINLITRQIYGINIFLILGMMLLGTILQHSLFLVILNITGLSVDLVGNIRYVLIPTLFFNLIFALPVYWVMRRIQKAIGQDALTNQTDLT